MAKEILMQIEETNKMLFSLLDSFDEKKLNKVPYIDSWTAAQVANHLLKSDRFLHNLLTGPTRETKRAADEHVQQLSDIFLNFDTKLKAPEIIIPDIRTFTKDEVLADLRVSRTNILDAAGKVELSLTSTIDSPLGESTMFEILHFHLVHTKRHLHQLEKIHHAVAD